MIGIPTSPSLLEEENEAGETDESDDTSDDTCQGPTNIINYFTNIARIPQAGYQMDDQCAPPAIAPTFVLEPPLEVEEGGGSDDVPVPRVGVVVSWFEEVVLEMGTTDGVLGVASGSLPAAFARVTSNALSYTPSVRYIMERPAGCAYGIVHECPVWD